MAKKRATETFPLSFEAEVVWNQEHVAADTAQTHMHQTKLYGVLDGHGVVIEMAAKDKKFELGQKYKITIEETS